MEKRLKKELIDQGILTVEDLQKVKTMNNIFESYTCVFDKHAQVSKPQF